MVPESVARTLKEYVPSVVAAPVMDPDELSVRPGGKLPLGILQVTVPIPFAAESCCE